MEWLLKGAINKMRKTILIITIIFLSIGCTSKREKITSKKWKYQDGYHIGDVIEFNSSHFTIDDSCKIYKNNSLVAKVTSINRRKLTIESGNNQTGNYISIGN